MTLELYGHPFSSYCQKVLIALYENATPFEWRTLSPEHPDTRAQFAAMWPLKRFPLLKDGDATVTESTVIIEYLGLHYPGPVRLVPDDPRVALEARHMDRMFDNYVSTPVQKIVFDSMREPHERDARGVADARAMLDTAYGWLERTLAERDWAAGRGFSLADCAAAPALFYADWTHRIDARFEHLIEYRKRLLARPSFARAVDEARPFRPFFPLGAPDRD
jgi:glutathione S-transferase